MSDKELRREERSEEGANKDLAVIVQDGFNQRRLLPKLIDYSRTGAKFEDINHPEIQEGVTVTIRIFVGSPPKKQDILAKINWVHRHGGKLSFGVEFFEPQEVPPRPS